jgi:hypothetical protein
MKAIPTITTIDERELIYRSLKGKHGKMTFLRLGSSCGEKNLYCRNYVQENKIKNENIYFWCEC